MSASDDNEIKVWNILECELSKSLIGHTSGVKLIRLSENGNFLVSIGGDKKIIVWDWE